jgi:hypothetical protein
MKGKFLIESFDEYIKDVYSVINEAESSGLTPEESKMIVSSLIESQSKRALSTSKVTSAIEKIFGSKVLQDMKKLPGKRAGPNEGIVQSLKSSDSGQKESVNQKRNDFFKKIIEFDSELKEMNLGKTREENKNFRPAIIMGLFSQFMTDESRSTLEKNLTKRSSELKITYKTIKKQIEDKGTDVSTTGQAPAILGYVDAREIEEIEDSPGKDPQVFTLLDEKNQSTLFLDNSWDLDPKVGKILREQLYGVFERRKSGGYTKILELSIQSSASRYRNTGKAENLSWGQLAFKRSQVIYDMMKEILEELQIPEGDPIREELNSVAKMNINGSNGDGTSGPNPTGVRTGYYTVSKPQTKNQTGSSTFKDVEGADKLMITKIDGFGNPEGEPTEKKMAPLGSKEEYDRFKYVNVSVKIQETNIIPGGDPKVSVKKVPANTIAPEVILERKGRKGKDGEFSFKFKLPKFRLSLPVGIGDVNPIQDMCGGF